LPHQKLSEREYQVVHMLSKGKTVGAISKELNLSVKTVSTYRVRALKKMNFKTNAELIRYMIQYKLG
jgi:DNA-binding NarL/FixJ family response regulator